MEAKKVIFLDRDGVILKDVPYLREPEKVELLPYVKAILTELKAHGYTLVIVSNQSGVGRGIIMATEFVAVKRKMNELLGEGLIDGEYYCFHAPDENCLCRKPRLGLFYQAERELGEIDRKNSYLFGDKFTDILAGRAYGVVTIKVGARSFVENYAIKGLEDLRSIYDIWR